MNSAKLVEILNHAFEFFGGKPKTLVFDQDNIVVDPRTDSGVYFIGKV